MAKHLPRFFGRLPLGHYLVGRRSLRADEQLSHPDDGEVRMWRLGKALAVSFSAAVAGLVGLAVLAWILIGAAGYRRNGLPALKDSVSVLQLVFASVAGAGALVALVVAYRRQKLAETESQRDRTRVLNERFIAIAAQLGDTQPAVRLAGIHAMAGLAADWEGNRQTCVDVLCAYLRLPYDPNPGEITPADRAAHQAIRLERLTIIRLICDHLRPEASAPWKGLNLDFTGVVFDGGDFSGARFSGNMITFEDAEFSTGRINFFDAQFIGRQVNFRGAKFSGGQVSFVGAVFSGETYFDGAEFCGSHIYFAGAKFSGAKVDFSGAKFSGGLVNFDAVRDGDSDPGARIFNFTVPQSFGLDVSFSAANFLDQTTVIFSAEFSGGAVNLRSVLIADSQINFNGAKFSGGQVDLNDIICARSRVTFDFKRDAVPAGVTLTFAQVGITESERDGLAAGHELDAN